MVLILALFFGVVFCGQMISQNIRKSDTDRMYKEGLEKKTQQERILEQQRKYRIENDPIRKQYKREIEFSKMEIEKNNRQIEENKKRIEEKKKQQAS